MLRPEILDRTEWHVLDHESDGLEAPDHQILASAVDGLKDARAISSSVSLRASDFAAPFGIRSAIPGVAASG